MSPADANPNDREHAGVAGHRIGPYSVVSLLGRGGMGSVFQVRHSETGVDYALKLLNRDAANASTLRSEERFKREVELLARVDAHPSLVRIHSSGEFDGCLYCVMELAAGDSLDKRLESGPLSPDEVVDLALQLADGLDHIHDLGVVHRDLKPANVILDDHGRTRLVDFGLADSNTVETLTATSQALGTPLYMAPEQIQVSHSDDPLESIGPWTDVYGLGMVMYCALTSQQPYESSGQLALMRKILSNPPTPPSQWVQSIPHLLEAIVLKALERRPADRYQSAGELAADLMRFRDGALDSADIEGWGISSASRRNPLLRLVRAAPLWLTSLALVAIVTALAAGSFVVASRLAQSRSQTRSRIRAQVVSQIASRMEHVRNGGGLSTTEAADLLQKAQGAGLSVAGISDARLLVFLARSFQGDHGWVEQVDFVSSPWKGQQSLVADVLCRSGGIAGFSLLLQRQPNLLRREGVAEVAAGAIADGQLTAGWDLVWNLAGALEQIGGDHVMSLHWRILEIGLAGCLEAMPVDSSRVLTCLGKLAALHDRPVEMLHLPTSALDQLGAVAVDAATGSLNCTHQEVEWLVGLALMQLPRDHPRLDYLLRRLGAPLVVEPFIKVDAATKAHSLAKALAVLRSERIIFRMANLKTLAPPKPSELEELVHKELKRGSTLFRASDVGALFLCLVLRGPQGTGHSDRKISSLLAAAECQWLLQALLIRERDHEDLPAWLLAGLGTMIQGWRQRNVVANCPAAVNQVGELMVAVIGGRRGDPLALATTWLMQRAVERKPSLQRSLKPPKDILAAVAVWFAQPDSGLPYKRFEEVLELLRECYRNETPSEDYLLETFGYGPELSNHIDQAGIIAAKRVLKNHPFDRAGCQAGESLGNLVAAMEEIFPETALGAEIEAFHRLHHGEVAWVERLLDTSRDGRSPSRNRMGLLTDGARALYDRDHVDSARRILTWSLPRTTSRVAGDYYRRSELWKLLGANDRSVEDLQRALDLERR